MIRTTPTVIGNANPDFFGGLGTTVAYKGISLNAFFQYSVGNDVMNLNSAYFLPGNANVNCYRELAEKMWTPENPDTDVARPGNSYIYSVDSRFVENGSFLRLSSLTLAYDLPATYCNTSAWLQPEYMQPATTCSISATTADTTRKSASTPPARS